MSNINNNKDYHHQTSTSSTISASSSSSSKTTGTTGLSPTSPSNNKTIISSSSTYHYSSNTTTTSSINTYTSASITSGGGGGGNNSGGILSQPYRNYLTDRNHFYHSASQPTTFTSTTSSSPRPTSTIINSIQQSTNQQQQQQQIPSARDQYQQKQQQQQPQYQQSKHQQSLFSSLGIHSKLNGNNTGSKQSLNSQSSNYHNKMAAAINNKQQQQQQQHRSNSSLAIDGGNIKTSINNIDDDDDYDLYPQSACSKFFYGLLWTIAQLGLFGSVAGLVYWFFKFDKGFAYQNDKRKMFNLHAFLMLTGFIFVNGQSMLIYKTYLCCKKIYNKIMHAFFFVISIGLVSFGFLIGFQAQSISSSPDQQVQHFYSLHSWIGLTVCALFALQFLFGFITFLVLLCCDRSTAGYRSRFLPTHVTFGLIIFILAIATCLTGLLQTARSRLTGPTLTEPGRFDYRDMRIEDFNIFLNSGIVINIVGACIILLSILIPYLVLNFTRNRPSTFYVN